MNIQPINANRTIKKIKAFGIVYNNKDQIFVFEKLKEERPHERFLPGNYNIFGGTKKRNESIRRTLERRIWYESNGIYSLKNKAKPSLFEELIYNSTIYKFYAIPISDLQVNNNIEEVHYNFDKILPVISRKGFRDVYSVRKGFVDSKFLQKKINEHKKKAQKNNLTMPATYTVLSLFIEKYLS